MQVYSAADAVVGLDVDKDSFDKFRWPLATASPIPTSHARNAPHASMTFCRRSQSQVHVLAPAPSIEP